jgi:hypothetical protein
MAARGQGARFRAGRALFQGAKASERLKVWRGCDRCLRVVACPAFGAWLGVGSERAG